MSFSDIVIAISGPLFTFLAGLVGVRIGIRQIRLHKGYEFIEKQLNEFYSPLLGIRQDIKAKSELRFNIHNAAQEAWTEISKKHEGDLQWDHEKEFVPFPRLIDYDNNQLTTDLLPQYREMLRIFKEKMWLAEPETRKWYSDLSSFIDIWDRWLNKSIPSKVLQKLDHSESRLHEFYRHIEDMHDCLRSKLPRPK